MVLKLLRCLGGSRIVNDCYRVSIIRFRVLKCLLRTYRILQALRWEQNTCIYIYVYMHTMCVNVYVYIYMYVCMYVCM